MPVGKSEKVLHEVILDALNEEVISKIANVLNYAKILAFVKTTVTGTNTITVYFEGGPNINEDDWTEIGTATLSSTGYAKIPTEDAYGVVRIRVKMTSYTDGQQVINAWINRKRH